MNLMGTLLVSEYLSTFSIPKPRGIYNEDDTLGVSEGNRWFVIRVRNRTETFGNSSKSTREYCKVDPLGRDPP